jgi:hypothetical protein
MKASFILILLFIFSCSSYSDIHNSEQKYRQKKMLRQDRIMKKKMQRARDKATPGIKIRFRKRVRRKYV